MIIVPAHLNGAFMASLSFPSTVEGWKSLFSRSAEVFLEKQDDQSKDALKSACNHALGCCDWTETSRNRIQPYTRGGILTYVAETSIILNEVTILVGIFQKSKDKIKVFRTIPELIAQAIRKFGWSTLQELL